MHILAFCAFFFLHKIVKTEILTALMHCNLCLDHIILQESRTDLVSIVQWLLVVQFYPRQVSFIVGIILD